LPWDDHEAHTTGRVHSVSLGRRKGEAKQPADQIVLIQGFGVEGDAHAGPGKRQISLIAREDVQALKAQGIEAAPGDFAENITVHGVDLACLAPGDRIAVGDALLEVTECGKAEWKEGDYAFQGVPLVARKGIFARVLRGGAVKPDDAVTLTP